MTERDDDGYADLRSYAAIGDGRTVALIARDGRVDWLPVPDVTSPPVFAALLDPSQGGYVALAPTGPYTVQREYVDRSGVLRTTFTTQTGTVAVTDSLNTGTAGRLPWAELARRVDGIDGTVELRGEVVPGTCLRTASPWLRSTHTGDRIMRADGLSLGLRLLGAEEVTEAVRHVDVLFTTTAGSRHLLGLVATEKEPLFLPDAEEVDAGVDRTVATTSEWLGRFAWDGPWAEPVERSVMTLKRLVYAPTGAVVAAPTTSVPESAYGAKNWDYRFAWVRDMAYTLSVLFRFGLREEIHAAISWLFATIRRHGPHPRIFYTLDGDLPDGSVEERDVPGWRGASPVREGNAAIAQLQLGVFGDLFSIVRLYVDHGNVLDEWTGRTMALVADTACDTWRSKDAGMWELETARHYTTSKMGCWQALRDAVHLAELGEIQGDVERWRTEAELIRAWVEEHCWSEERGAYVWYPGTDRLDASVTLHAISGFDRGERMRRTLDALDDELGVDGNLYRWSGAQEEEATFVACSFWWVSATCLVGRHDAAEKRMERLLATVPNDVGLLAEMYDPGSGTAWGNLPQALSHLALVHAAITLTDPENR